MKKTLLIVISLLFLITSCKKKSGDNPTPVNTIAATVDGVNETFNVKVTASQTNIGGINVLIISGEDTSESNSGAISIEIDTTGVITKGIYPIKTGIPGGFNSGTSISYVKGYSMLYPSSDTTLPNSIAISNINSTSVQGTFNVKLSGGSLGAASLAKTITNGKFNVAIK